MLFHLPISLGAPLNTTDSLPLSTNQNGTLFGIPRTYRYRYKTISTIDLNVESALINTLVAVRFACFKSYTAPLTKFSVSDQRFLDTRVSVLSKRDYESGLEARYALWALYSWVEARLGHGGIRPSMCTFGNPTEVGVVRWDPRHGAVSAENANSSATPSFNEPSLTSKEEGSDVISTNMLSSSGSASLSV